MNFRSRKSAIIDLLKTARNEIGQPNSWAGYYIGKATGRSLGVFDMDTADILHPTIVDSYKFIKMGKLDEALEAIDRAIEIVENAEPPS